MGKIQHLTDTTFSSALENDTPVLVEFWAEWCGPCRQLAPILDKIADEREGTLNVAKVDIDANPLVTEKYGITSIPAMILFKDGKAVATSIGAKPKHLIEADFVSYL